MTDKITGGCHCGKVRWEAETVLDTVYDCNCSHCSKKGFLLTFVPLDKFTLLSGEDALTEYKFNRHMISHLFCAACGVQSHGRGVGADGVDTAAINARCVDDVDLAALTIQPVDGKSY